MKRLSIQDQRIIDAYLTQKYAYFNKPEQDCRIDLDPIIEPPFINVDACVQYNTDLMNFRNSSLEDRVELIFQKNQSYCNEQTFEAHITQLVYNLAYAYKNGYAYKNMPVPSVQEFMDSLNALNIENVYHEKAIMFHLIDILYNDPSDRNAYPFLDNVIAFNHRIDFIEATFMTELCEMIYDGHELSYALLVSLKTYWAYEQNDKNGIRLKFVDNTPNDEANFL
jgi:hypothetical protein